MSWRLALIGVAFIVCPAMASISISATVTPDNVRWHNAVKNGNEVTPTAWVVPTGLLPAERWIPGGVTVAPQHLVLNGVGQITIPLSITGVEYSTLTSATSVVDHGGTQHCDSAHFDGNQSSVKSTSSADVLNCVAPWALEFSQAYTPYSFVRPIFNIVDNDLITALAGKPSGDYLGSVTVATFYEFYRNGIRSRRVDSTVVSVQITYDAEKLTSVSLDDIKQMDLHYRQDSVSGLALFNGSAQGLFSNGVKVSLDPIRNRSYALLPNVNSRGTSNDDNSISYNIKCNECADVNLVLDGQVVAQSTVLNAPDGTTAIPFTIVVDFFDQTLTPLEVGTYQDSFILMFELNL